MSLVPTDEVAAIRSRLDHPVIDSDGHLIEFLPLVRDHLVDEAGESVAKAFDTLIESGRLLQQVPPDARRRLGRSQSAWWGLPTRNTLDRASAMLPALLRRRLDEIGIDFAVLYPTAGLMVTATPDEELRRAMARAFNRYYADAYADHRDRLAPVACIPTFTPEEAVAELEHAVGELGLRAVMLAGVIPRPYAGAEDTPGRWIDTIGHDSAHDYDVVWAACGRLGVTPTFHATGMGWGSRTSTTNYVYNHIGNFAAAGEATARSLFFGGVPRRFPSLRFAFQEGGVALACSLLADTVSHWEKRNATAVRNYDPAQLDLPELRALLETHAGSAVRANLERLAYGLSLLSEPVSDPSTIDEFASCGIETAEDIVDVFTRQYHFGCEADDRLNALAFDRRLHPHGARLRAVFASDIGHWDVPDARDVLPEAYELVEDGLLDESDFRDFVFGNAVSLWGGDDGAFFAGTVVEPAVRRHLARARLPSGPATQKDAADG